VPADREMVERVARHRAQRPSTWPTIEEPLNLAARTSETLGELPAGEATILVEDLTLWLANLFDAFDPDPEQVERRAFSELDRLFEVQAHVVLVSNEVGMGIVPAYPSGRVFRDALGRLNQHAAAICNEAYLLVAGLPVRLK
jgi:adenosylcobinamide kinase/adenosylcobinamide-phosphate guanylyltransferase